VQPALGDPALAGVGLGVPRGPFQPRPFCDSGAWRVLCALPPGTALQIIKLLTPPPFLVCCLISSLGFSFWGPPFQGGLLGFLRVVHQHPLACQGEQRTRRRAGLLPNTPPASSRVRCRHLWQRCCLFVCSACQSWVSSSHGSVRFIFNLGSLGVLEACGSAGRLIPCEKHVWVLRAVLCSLWGLPRSSAVSRA